MRVLAATFQDQMAANAAQANLVELLPLGTHTSRIAALGRASDPSGPASVLAGRFENSVIRLVRDVVEGFGGTIVVDMDESRSQD